MDNARLRRFNSSVFKRTFALFVLSYLLPSMLIVVIAFVQIRHTVVHDQEEKIQETFNSSCATLDGKLQDLKRYSHLVSRLRWVNSIMALPEGSLNERVPPYDRLQNFERVKIIAGLVSGVEGVALCFPEQDTVISDLWYDRMDAFFSQDMVFPGMDAREWRELLLQCNEMTALPFCTISRLGLPARGYLTVIQTLSPNGGWEDSSMLYFIAEEQIQGYFRTLLEGGGQLSIRSGDGEILLYSGGEAPAAPAFSCEKALTNSGWSVRVSVPIQGNEYSRYVTMYLEIAAVVVILCGLVMSFKLASTSYAPLYNVVKTVLPEHARLEDTGREEYSLLMSGWMQIHKEAEQYKDQLRGYQELEKRYCVGLLTQEWKEHRLQAQKYLSDLGISFAKDLYRCILIACGAQAGLPENIDAALSGAEIETLSARIGSGITVLCAYTESFSPRFDSFLQRLQELLREQSVEVLAAVIGSEEQGLEELAGSYASANRVLNLRLSRVAELSPEERWHRAERTVGERVDIRFDVHQEEILANLVKTGDGSGAVSFVQSILEGNAHLGTDDRRQLCSLLRYFPFRVLDKETCQELSARLDGAEGDPSTQDPENGILAFYMDVCEIQMQSMKQKSDKLAGWIFRFVCDNLFRSELSLQLLSDEFGMSVSQVSKYFKAAAGSGFAEWVSTERIRHACELLLRDVPLAQIPIQCGFSSEPTFRRTFKKVTGVSPGAWREANQGAQPPADK